MHQVPKIVRQKRQDSAKSATPRELAAQRSRQELLQVAIEEFAAHGLAGARVDAIAERTRTSKAMIYYHFGSKEAMYGEVLAHVYALIGASEQTLALDDEASAEKMLTRFVEHTFDFHENNPVFSRIIHIENTNHSAALRLSPQVKNLNRPVIDILTRILHKGVAAQQFRDDIEAVELHLTISALCLYRMSNRSTFGLIFGVDFSAPAVIARQRELAVQAVLGLVRHPLLETR
jgi:AcrR family transcriptional regulator